MHILFLYMNYFEPYYMRRKNCIQNLFCFLMILLPAALFAQTPGRETLSANLQQLATGFPQEKAYIQFDKPAYAPGETIWYKAYLMTGFDPSLISSNFYLDFADADGKILAHAVVPVVQSSAKGNFDIPASFSGRSIHIRAYTKWMLNFDSAFLFDKDIRIVQTKPAAIKTPVVANTPAVQFFPEGGDCIAGINTKIAFKAEYTTGNPCNIKGTVVNAKGVSVADLKCIHDGMGYFYLDAQAGEKYTAKWKDEKGKQYETVLPSIKSAGVTFEIKLAEGKRGFLIKRSDDVIPAFKNVYIVATLQQQLVYMASVKLNETNVVGGSIPVDQLPSGILQVTLFDSNWVAIAERITFINNDDYHFEPEVGFAALGTSKRGKNVLVINVPDSIEANLSVAVTDAGIGIDSSDNIFSRLLLTGDLKGRVHNPYYYFSNNSDSIQEQLDLVMLTNGWRKIKWEDVLYGKMPAIKYPNDTAYLSLAGKVFGGTATDMRQTSMLFMILSHQHDTTKQAIQSFIDKNGNFSEPDILMFDTTKIYYQFIGGNKDMINSTEVTFNSGIIPSPGKINFDKTTNPYLQDTATENRNRFFAEQEARLAKLMEGNTLAGVTVKTKVKSPVQVLDEKYASGLFSGGDAEQFDIQNDISSRGALNILNYLKGRVAGLNISTGSTAGGQSSATWRGSTPAFFLNEMNVDISQLESINMSDVAYVKVFRPPFIGAFGGGSGGAIAVYTQKGASNTNIPKGKGLPSKTIIGYAPEKQFYSPNYGTFDQRNEEEDLRSTIYWNPMIITTQKNHMARLSFYNNDITGSFRVIVEGVSKDGKLVHIEKLIE